VGDVIKTEIQNRLYEIEADFNVKIKNVEGILEIE